MEKMPKTPKTGRRPYKREDFTLTNDIGDQIKQYRQAMKMSQYDLGQYIGGVSATTIQNIERGKNVSNTNETVVDIRVVTLFDICKALQINASDLLKKVEEKRLGEVEKQTGFPTFIPQYDNSQNHLFRLKKYVNLELTGYYYTTEKSGDHLVKCQINTKSCHINGFVPFTLQTSGHKYEGKIVSPPDNNYTFFYLSEQGDKAERAIITIIHNKGREGSYKGGVGSLYSSSRGRKSILCTQKIVLFSKEVLASENVDIISEPFRNNMGRYLQFRNQVENGKLYMDCLDDLDEEWYNQFCKGTDTN